MRVGVRGAQYDERRKTLVLQVCYTGSAEELVSKGIATADMVVPAPSDVRHIRRRDNDSDYFRLSRQFSSRGSEPYWRCRLTLFKPYEAAMRLPDAYPAWLRYSNSEAWRRRVFELAEQGIFFERVDTRTKMSAPEPPRLRLIVDNTRPLKPVERSGSPGPMPRDCPFCGPTTQVLIAIVIHPEQCGPGEKPVYQCGCEGCGASGPRAHSDREAVRRWNRRGAPAAPGPLSA
ncbi:MAG: hypothetical protein ACREU3_02135 [Steroidobacteraceae bacterium]